MHTLTKISWVFFQTSLKVETVLPTSSHTVWHCNFPGFIPLWSTGAITSPGRKHEPTSLDPVWKKRFSL